MKIVHIQCDPAEPKPKALTKKQLYHEQMVQAVRRKEYKDYLAALKDPEIIALIKEVQKVSPGWMPKFKG